MAKTLKDVIDGYYAFRNLERPNSDQALLFLVSEIGELADAQVSQQAEWTRNNPEKRRDIAAEIGDVQMMLTVFAESIGLDPVGCMLDKMASKGYASNTGDVV